MKMLTDCNEKTESIKYLLYILCTFWSWISTNWAFNFSVALTFSSFNFVIASSYLFCNDNIMKTECKYIEYSVPFDSPIFSYSQSLNLFPLFLIHILVYYVVTPSLSLLMLISIYMDIQIWRYYRYLTLFMWIYLLLLIVP